MSSFENRIIRALTFAERNPESDEAFELFEAEVKTAVLNAQYEALDEALDWSQPRGATKDCLLTAHANAIGHVTGGWLFFIPVFVGCKHVEDYLEFSSSAVVPMKSPLLPDFLRQHLAGGDPSPTFCIPQFVLNPAALGKIGGSQAATELTLRFVQYLAAITATGQIETPRNELMSAIPEFCGQVQPPSIPGKAADDLVFLPYLLPVLVGIPAAPPDAEPTRLEMLVSSMGFSGEEWDGALLKTLAGYLAGNPLRSSMGLREHSGVVVHAPIRVWDAPQVLDGIREAIILAKNSVS